MRQEGIRGSGGTSIAPFCLTSAVDGGERPALRPCRFISGERAHGTHWIGGWVGSRVRLEAVKRNNLHYQESNPVHRAPHRKRV
jgi:hypothetical protein